MTFEELVKSIDDAICHKAATSSALETALSRRLEVIAVADKAVALAQDADARATDVVSIAHKGMHDVLKEFGHHLATDPEDGTIWVYECCDDGLGWKRYQPIPVTLPKMVS